MLPTRRRLRERNEVNPCLAFALPILQRTRSCMDREPELSDWIAALGLHTPSELLRPLF